MKIYIYEGNFYDSVKIHSDNLGMICVLDILYEMRPSGLERAFI